MSEETPRATFDLTLVIACYNEAEHLEGSVAELVRTLRSTRRAVELIFIEDCSADGTPELVRRLTADLPNTRCIVHEKNVGRGGTVVEGFRLARGEIVGFIDIDLEVHCRYIPLMLQAIEEGADGATAYRVYGVRFRPMAILRHILSRGYRILFRWMLDVPFRDTETGYKFFRREKILPVLEETQDRGWFWDTEIMVLAHLHGLHVVEIPCPFIQRTDKTSTVRIVHDVLEYFKALWRFRRRVRARRAPERPRA